MTDQDAVLGAARRRWAEAAERSARELAAAARALDRAHREIRERAAAQAREWSPSARALGKAPDDERLDIRSEEDRQRRAAQANLIDRAARRRPAGDALLHDSFEFAEPVTAPEPAAQPVAPQPDAFLPRSMRDRARRRAEES